MTKYILKENDLIEIINQSLINEGNIGDKARTAAGFVGNAVNSGTKNFAQGFNAGRDFINHPWTFIKRKAQEKMNQWAYSGNINYYQLRQAATDFINFGGEAAKNDIGIIASYLIYNYTFYNKSVNLMGTDGENKYDDEYWKRDAKYSALKNKFSEYSNRFLHPVATNDRNKEYNYKQEIKLKTNYMKLISALGINCQQMIQQDTQQRQNRINNRYRYY